VDYWGWTAPNADPDGERAYLTKFYSSIGHSDWAKTLQQYSGAGQSITYEGAWNDNSPVPGLAPTGAQIASEGLDAVAHFGLTTDLINDEIVVALPSGVSFANAVGGTACAYHIASAVPLTALPYLADPPSSGCGVNVNDGSPLLDSLGEFAGHELAETITDPERNAWLDVNDGQEIADKCEFYNDSDVMGSSGQQFASQALWDNQANTCELGSQPAGGSWTTPYAQGLSTTAGLGPSIISTGGSIYEAYKGPTSTKVFVVVNHGGGWSTPYRVSGATTLARPSIAVLGGQFYVLWTAAVAPHLVMESVTASLSASWSSPAPIGTEASSTGPSLCKSGSDLYLAYKAATTASMYISVFNGSVWSNGHRNPFGSTSLSPGIACSPGVATELLTWTTSSDQVESTWFKNGAFSGGASTIPGALSSAGPASALFAATTLNGGSSTWVVAFKGKSNDGVFYVDDLSSQLTAKSWSNVVQIPLAATTGSPSIASLTNVANPPPALGRLTLYAGWGTTTGGLEVAASNEPSPIGVPGIIGGAVPVSGPALAVTDQTPGSCTGSGTCFVTAWEGAGDQLYWSSAPEHVAQTTYVFGPPTAIAGATSTAVPALGTMGGPGGKVYMADMGSGGSIEVDSLTGATWSAVTPPGNANTGAPPALTGGTIASGPAAGSYLFLSWKGEGTDPRVFFAYLKAGASSWTSLGQVPGASTNDGPSLTVNGGTLIDTWTDATTNALFQNTMSLSTLGSWNSATRLGGAVGSSSGPSTTTTSYGVSVTAWKSESNREIFSDTFLASGATSLQGLVSGIATNESPAVVASLLGPTVLLEWKDSATGDLMAGPLTGS
jgi:hypothetical protein